LDKDDGDEDNEVQGVDDEVLDDTRQELKKRAA
jgi:hypothetical protein